MKGPGLGLGLGPGLTVNPVALGSGGSEARKTTRLQKVLEKEEVHSSGRLLWMTWGSFKRFTGVWQDVRFHQQGKETLFVICACGLEKEFLRLRAG